MERSGRHRTAASSREGSRAPELHHDRIPSIVIADLASASKGAKRLWEPQANRSTNYVARYFTMASAACAAGQGLGARSGSRTVRQALLRHAPAARVANPLVTNLCRRGLRKHCRRQMACASPRLLHAQLAGYGQPLNFRSPLADFQSFGVAQVALDGIFAHVAGTSVNL